MSRTTSLLLLCIYVTLLILTPIKDIGLGIPFRLDDILLLYLVWRMPKDNSLNLSISSKIALLFCLSCFVSLIIASAGGGKFQFTDANDVLVLFRLFLIIVVVQSYVRSKLDIQKVILFFYSSVCISAIVAALQYFNPGSIAEALTSLYSQDDKYLKVYYVSIQQLRVISTFGNPNESALFFTLGSICSIHIIINRIGHYSYNSAILIALVFLIIFATGSRGGLVILFVSILTYLSGIILLGKKKYRLFYAVLFILVITSLSSLFNVYFFEYIQVPHRMMKLFQHETISTNLYDTLMQSRSNLWIHAITQIQYHGHYFLGNGPGPGFVVDSEYLYVLFTQGIVGLLLYVLFLWYPIFRSIRIWSNQLKSTAVLAATGIMATVLYAILAPVIYAAKLGPTLAILIALWGVVFRLGNPPNGIAEQMEQPGTE